MFIAIVDFTTSAADRPAAIARLRAERPGVLSMPGCTDFRVVTPPDDDVTVSVLHECADEDAFAGYLASPAFARSGEVLRPMMTAPPVSRRFRAELVETPT